MPQINKKELIKQLEDSKWRYKMAREIKKNPTQKYQAHTEGYLQGLDLAIYLLTNQ